MADTKDSRKTTKDAAQADAKDTNGKASGEVTTAVTGKAAAEGTITMTKAEGGKGSASHAAAEASEGKDSKASKATKATKATETRAQADGSTASTGNIESDAAPADAALETAQRNANAARQRIRNNINKHPEFELLYVAGGKGEMPRVLSPETPFEDAQMSKAYDKLRKDVDSLIEARKNSDRLRDDRKTEKAAKNPSSKSSKPMTGDKETATVTAAAHDTAKLHGGKPAKEGRAAKTPTAGKPQGASDTKKGNSDESHHTEAAQKEDAASAPNVKPAKKASEEKQAGGDDQHATSASQRKPRQAHETHDVTAKADDTGDRSKPSANGKASDSKPMAQRTTKSDGTAGTGTLALTKDDAAKPTAEANGDATKKSAENAKPHDKKTDAGDTKGVNKTAGAKSEAMETTNGNDGAKQASIKAKQSEQKQDSKGNNGVTAVTAGSEKQATSEKPAKQTAERKQPTSAKPAIAAQEDGKATVTTAKPDTKDIPERTDAHVADDAATQHDKQDANANATKQPQQKAETKRTQGKGQQEMATSSHVKADNAAEETIKPAARQSVKPMAEPDNAHCSKAATADTPASAKANNEHAESSKHDEGKADIGDDGRQKAKQPDAMKPQASGDSAVTASDAKPAERAAQRTSQKQAAPRQDAKQEDDATPHAAEQQGGGKESPAVTPSDDAEGHDGTEKPAEPSTSVTEHEPVAESSVTEPDRMSCHDDAQTCSFDKAPDEVIERIGTLDEDVIHDVPVYAHRSRAQWSHDGIAGHARVHASTETDVDARSAQHMATDGGFFGRIGRAFRSLFGR